MIIYRRKEIKQEQFGDGTLKAIVPENLLKKYTKFNFSFFGNSSDEETITWCYDNDAELFTLRCLVDTIREVKGISTAINLQMPYIPHARQDRKVSDRFFTLKSFARMINDMNFNQVIVLDPHSDVSTALIDRCNEESKLISFYHFEEGTVFMYPDAGAAKKYNASSEDIIGNKKRNSEGRIVEYELLNFKEGTEKVVIVDDICSYGGTFVAAAKALREKGVKIISLMVSHCEDNIMKGDVFNYIDHVYTTDSICHLKETGQLHFCKNLTWRELDKDDTDVEGKETH